MSDQRLQQFGAPRAQCLQFDSDLPAYLEGEDRPSVASHARECAYCRVILADLKLIQAEAGEVLLEDPPARVWANVRATLAAEGIFREPVSGWLRWIPQTGLLRYSAPVAALGVLTLFATLLLLQPRSSVNGPSESSTQALEKTVGAMEQSYRARAKSFDPAVRASYQKGLDSLDDSIRECKVSVQHEPFDSLAQEYLATAYEQKAAVLSAALEYNGR